VRLVREQNTAGDIADGIDMRVARLLVLVHFHETFFVERDFGVLQTEVAAVRLAANGTSTRS